MEKITYTIIKDPVKNIDSCIESSSGLLIPLDPANSDYQAYLAWLENPQGQQSTPMVTGDVNAD
jgi:hypothetical protein